MEVAYALIAALKDWLVLPPSSLRSSATSARIGCSYGASFRRALVPSCRTSSSIIQSRRFLALPSDDGPGAEPEPAHEVLDILSELKTAEEEQEKAQAPSEKKEKTPAFRRALCCLGKKEDDDEEAPNPNPANNPARRRPSVITIKQRERETRRRVLFLFFLWVAAEWRRVAATGPIHALP